MKRRLIAAVSLLVLAASLTAQQPEELTDPIGRLIDGFDAPGTYPTQVTAANINLMPSPGSGIDGVNEDVFRAEFPSGGPILWTTPRMNAGDIALSIGPAFPDNPLSFPSGDPGFQDNFQALNDDFEPIDPNTTELTTLAWRTSSLAGAHLTTTRFNGADLGYELPGGDPVGMMHGVTYVSAGPGRQGWGFSMEDGSFQNGTQTATEVHTGHAGGANGNNEAVFDIATAYFPYEAGWKGAWVQGAESGEATFDGASPDVLEEEVVWESGLATVQLTDIDSATDGMLFVAPSNGSSTSRIASAFPAEDGGWITTIRLDADDDTSGQSFQNGDAFQFLYIPYDAANLIGGHVEGADGSTINSAGDSQFTLAMAETGRFTLSVFESDGQTKKTEDSGMLILSVADAHPEDATIGSRAFMSYEFDEMSGDFIIESRELIDTLSLNSFDAYGNEFAPSDADFYFAWVDFTTPMTLGPFLPADFDMSGEVDFADFLTLSATFGNAVDPAGSSADIDGNGTVDFPDFLLLSASFGASTVPAAAVPEPASAQIIVFLPWLIAALRKRRIRSTNAC